MPQKSTLRYLRYGFLLSILSIFALQAWCAWQVYQYAHAPAALPKHADAAVVLGAAAWGDKPSPVFRERINHAIALYQSERVEKLIFTGGTRKEGYPSEGEVARKFAIKQGIPSHDILYETRSKDTYQNLVNTRLLIQKHKIHSVIIVSDPYHMARAVAIARDLGIPATPSPTPTSRYSGQNRAKFMASEVLSLMAFQWWRLSETVAAYGRDYLLSRQAGQ